MAAGFNLPLTDAVADGAILSAEGDFGSLTLLNVQSWNLDNQIGLEQQKGPIGLHGTIVTPGPMMLELVLTGLKGRQGVPWARLSFTKAYFRIDVQLLGGYRWILDRGQVESYKEEMSESGALKWSISFRSQAPQLIEP